MQIILEGPDGSGKSTLFEKLQRDLRLKPSPRFSTSLGGPVVDIFERTWEDMHEPWGQIYDRHPIFSEPIYAYVMGRPIDKRFFSPTYIEKRAHFYQRSMLVLCLPPKVTLKHNVLKTEQMKGVEERIDQLHRQYSELAQRIRQGIYPGRAAIYDYTIDGYDTIKEQICQSFKS